MLIADVFLLRFIPFCDLWKSSTFLALELKIFGGKSKTKTGREN